MIVKRADFITSMKDYGAFATKGCPEVAFAGKSNVGKSSMINRLTNRNKLARTSATPGKTRLINVYQINDEINFIDLPGLWLREGQQGGKALLGQDDAGLFCYDGGSLPRLSSGGYPP